MGAASDRFQGLGGLRCGRSALARRGVLGQPVEAPPAGKAAIDGADQGCLAAIETDPFAHNGGIDRPLAAFG